MKHLLIENEVVVSGYYEGSYHYALTNFGNLYRRHWYSNSDWEVVK